MNEQEKQELKSDLEDHLELHKIVNDAKKKRCGRFEQLVIKNRIGKFRITDPLIEQNLKAIMDEIFSKIFIVRAEHLYPGQFEYVGYCELFEEVPEGQMANEYDFIFNQLEDGTPVLSHISKIEW